MINLLPPGDSGKRDFENAKNPKEGRTMTKIEDEVVLDTQVPHQGDEEEVVFEHTSTDDWEQEIAIDVVALEGNSTPGEGNNIPDGNTDAEMGLHDCSRHPSKAEQESEVSRPKFSIN